MASASIRGVFLQLGQSIDSLSDSELLASFVNEKSEGAFAALVARHGPHVLGVCRRVLSNNEDVSDAFQAVFLVLARKAESIRPGGSVGGWLYGVAVRTAAKAKVAAARRRRREMVAASQPAREPEDTDPVQHAELCLVLDEELGRLPGVLRDAIVLCELNGKTRAQAATELGCPEGTIAARIHRARKRLAAALSKRGFGLPAAGLAAVLAPAPLSAQALQLGSLTATGACSSASANYLARSVSRGLSMRALSMKLGILTALSAGALLAAGTFYSTQADTQPGAPSNAESGTNFHSVRQAQETKPDVNPWRVKAVLKDAEDLVVSVAYDPKGKTLSAGCLGGTVATWSASDFKRQLIYNFFDPTRAQAVFVAYSPDGRYFAQTHRNGAYVSDVTTRKSVFAEEGVEDTIPRFEIPASELLDGNEVPRAIAFAAPETVKGVTMNRVAMTDGYKTAAKMWIDGGKPSTASMGSDPGAVNSESLPASIAYSPDGKQLVFTPNRRKFSPQPGEKGDPAKVITEWVALVWGGGSGVPMQFLTQGPERVTAVAWSPSGNFLATGGEEGGIILWDGKTFKEVRRTKVGDQGTKNCINSLTFSNDGKTLAIAATQKEGPNAGRVVFLDPTNGKQTAELDKFTTPPMALAFSPGGKTLIVGCGYLDLKDRKLTREERKTLGEVKVFGRE
jgi:RNA polymerase sigma factor (sigma-70 family)